MEKCIFCGWYRRTNDPSLKFFGVPREPGLKRMKWLYAIGDRELFPKDKVCSIHFRQGRPSNDPSHEDFAPHLFLRRTVSQPVAKTLTYLESFDDDEDLNVPSISPPEYSEPQRLCKPSILRKRRKEITSSKAQGENNTAKQPFMGNQAPKEDNFRSTALQEQCMEEINGFDVEEKPSKGELSNIVVMTDAEGLDKHVKLHHLPRAFVEAVGIKPGQTVIIKRRIRVAKSVRNQADRSEAMDNVLEKEGNIFDNMAKLS